MYHQINRRGEAFYRPEFPLLAHFRRRHLLEGPVRHRL